MTKLLESHRIIEERKEKRHKEKMEIQKKLCDKIDKLLDKIHIDITFVLDVTVSFYKTELYLI